MASCVSYFKQFDQNLKVEPKKMEALKAGRRHIRTLITNYFSKNYPHLVPTFEGQGSVALDTIINTKSGNCDLDEGVYFSPKPKESPKKIMEYVRDAVKDVTTENAQVREHCVRVVYRKNYHIDLPIYATTDKNTKTRPELGTKSGIWLRSDPIAFTRWVEQQKNQPQLKRIIRYLKAWADTRKKGMPKGVALTVLAAKHCPALTGDIDKVLYQTLQSMQKAIHKEYDNTKRITIQMPVAPHDDLLRDYPKPDLFAEALDTFVKTAEQAINQTSETKAAALWKEQLGSRFIIVNGGS